MTDEALLGQDHAMPETAATRGAWPGVLGRLLLPKLGWRGKLLVVLVMIACGVVLWDQVYGLGQAFRGLVRLDPLPQTRALAEQKRYAEAEEYLAFFLPYAYVAQNPEAVALYDEIRAKRADYWYKLQEIGAGFVLGQSAEFEGQVAAIVSDFLVIGDARDLIKEGLKWWHRENVDEFTAALSAIGIVATAGTAFSGGSTAAVKPGLSLLKMANKMDDVPKWLRSYLIKSARIVKETKRLDAVADLLDTVHDSYKASGARSTLILLKQADDVDSLKTLAKLSARFGKKTAVFMELSGDTGLHLLRKMDLFPTAVVLEAATFGKPGLRMLDLVGVERFQRFLRNTKLATRTTKILTNKYDLVADVTSDVLRQSVGRLPDWALASLMLYGGALLLRWK